MACAIGESNILGTEDITEENQHLFVTLEIPAGNFECYYLPTIYTIQKDAMILKEPFVSPFTKLEFTEEHVAKIEKVRQIFIKSKLEEAKKLGKQAERAMFAEKRKLLNRARAVRQEYNSYPPLYDFNKSMYDMDALINRISRATDPEEKNRFYEEFQDLLSKGIITPLTKDRNGETLLYYAIEAKNLELMEKLWPLSDPNAVTGMYPEGGASGTTKRYGYFSKACATGNKDIVDFVISKIAVNKAGIKKCREDLDEMTESSGLVIVANITEDPELVRELITLIGIDVNKSNKYGYTPLMIFARRQAFPTQLEILNILIDAGANLEARKPDGQTVLNHISEYGEADVLKLLLSRGANVNTFDNSLVTPLYYAAVASIPRVNIVQILVDNGAKLYKFGKKVGNNVDSNILVTLLNNEIDKNMEVNKWTKEKVDKLGMGKTNDARRAIVKILKKMPEEEIPSEVVPRPAVVVAGPPEPEPVKLTPAQQNEQIYHQHKAVLLSQGISSPNANRQARAFVKKLRSGTLNTRRAAKPGRANGLRNTTRNTRAAAPSGRAAVPATAQRSRRLLNTVAAARLATATAARAPGTYSRYARKRVGGRRVTYKHRI